MTALIIIVFQGFTISQKSPYDRSNQIFKMPTGNQNKITVTKELVEALKLGIFIELMISRTARLQVNQSFQATANIYKCDQWRTQEWGNRGVRTYHLYGPRDLSKNDVKLMGGVK